MEEFVRRSHSVGSNIHHLQWCTKKRYRMFRNPMFREVCKDAILLVARRHGIEILELAVMEEHAHAVARLPPWMSQSKAIQLLKGGTSYEIFRMIPNFRLRYPKGNLWSKGNFKASIGNNTTETVKKYIREQQLSLESFTRNCGL